jgi:hypothetical protein
MSVAAPSVAPGSGAASSTNTANRRSKRRPRVGPKGGDNDAKDAEDAGPSPRAGHAGGGGPNHGRPGGGGGGGGPNHAPAAGHAGGGGGGGGGVGQGGGPGGGGAGEEGEGRAAEGRAVRVPLGDIRPGHLLSKTEYMRVLEANPAANTIRAEVLRGDKANDVWEIRTPDALLACSTEYVQREQKLSKTELANRLVSCKDDVFKVVFRPVLSAEALAARMLELQQEIADADTEAKRRRVAKKLLEVPEKTIKGRLIHANNSLGYSLVDDLDQPDSQKVAFRNVAHGNILSLTVAGVRYVLK